MLLILVVIGALVLIWNQYSLLVLVKEVSNQRDYVIDEWKKTIDALHKANNSMETNLKILKALSQDGSRETH